MEWNGMEWNGMEWNGTDGGRCPDLTCPDLSGRADCYRTWKRSFSSNTSTIKMDGFRKLPKSFTEELIP
jgi:hypothetical protein